jgi:uncharacterized protein YbbC (DUF1343 family)
MQGAMTGAGNVVTGLERLTTDCLPEVRGMRAGLVTNPCGVDRTFTSSIEVISRLGFIALTALFGPEHGIRGEVQAGDHVAAETDRTTGLPIHSLYGETRMPTEEMLEGIDVMIVDLQDVGVRYATYLSTLDNVLQACHEHGKRVVVLDRPNPLDGVVVAGGLLQQRYRSFIGTHTIPVLHGMTLGELALLIAAERGYTKPGVVTMEGWSRGMLWDDTGLPWVFPSPNLPTLDTHLAYPGTCLIEGTNLSEGRGTTRPFELLGAPWIDPWAFAEAVRTWTVPGIAVRPVYSTPMFSKHAGTRCGAIQVYVDRSALGQMVKFGVRILQTLAEMYPDKFRLLEPPREGSRHFIDLLTGSDRLRHVLDSGDDTGDLLQSWSDESGAFKHRREPFLLYDSGR